MAWLNASGNPVAMQPVTIQIDIPCEAVANASTAEALSTIAANWGAILSAAIQLVIAMMTGNVPGIAAAIQALITAFMTK